MGKNRIDIMDLRQVIRLKKDGISNRKIAESLKISRNTVNEYVRFFETFQLNYEELLELDDKSIYELFPKESEIETYRFNELSSFFTYFEKELKKPGCTLQVLWREYINKHPNGYKHSQFNYHFNIWREKKRTSCKLEHKSAECLFVDYTGKKLSYIDKSTGEIIGVNVFVAVLPASSYTFVVASATQSKEDFIDALNKCLLYLGGVPKAIVSDNLKSAVTKSHKYEPTINRTIKDFAMHYGCVIDPTRPYSPQDKAMVEGAVKLVYQRIFYPLSNFTFFSLRDINNEISPLLEQYNNYTLSLQNSTRQQEFLSFEKEFLQALPDETYEIKQFKRLKVQKMGYIYLSDDKHYYSTPFKHIGHHVDVQYSHSIVEIFYERERIALHKRDYRNGKYTTNSDHLTSSHKAYSQWSLSFFQDKAKLIGEFTWLYITDLIQSRPYPETAYKQSWGILMLSKQYSYDRIENACKRVQNQENKTYFTIENILKKGLDKEDIEDQTNEYHIPNHLNIRGANAYN